MNVYLGVYLVGYDSFPLSGNMSWLTQCSIDDDDEDDGGGGDDEVDSDEENYCDVDKEGDGKEGF